MIKEELTFTKPQWAWQKFGDHYCLTAQHSDREIILGGLSHPDYLRQPAIPAMNYDGRLEPVDPKHPNAILIEHAPEMYESLILITKKLEKHIGEEGSINENTWIKKEYATAKELINKMALQ